MCVPSMFKFFLVVFWIGTNTKGTLMMEIIKTCTKLGVEWYQNMSWFLKIFKLKTMTSYGNKAINFMMFIFNIYIDFS